MEVVSLTKSIMLLDRMASVRIVIPFPVLTLTTEHCQVFFSAVIYLLLTFRLCPSNKIKARTGTVLPTSQNDRPISPLWRWISPFKHKLKSHFSSYAMSHLKSGHERQQPWITHEKVREDCFSARFWAFTFHSSCAGGVPVWVLWWVLVSVFWSVRGTPNYISVLG